MTKTFDARNATQEEFEAWACPDGVPRKIRSTLLFNPWVKFVEWHKGSKRQFKMSNGEHADCGHMFYDTEWQLYEEPAIKKRLQAYEEPELDKMSTIDAPEEIQNIIEENFNELLDSEQPEQIDKADMYKLVDIAKFLLEHSISFDEHNGHEADPDEIENLKFVKSIQRRIKPQRTPQVDDVWERKKDGKRFIVYRVNECRVLICEDVHSDDLFCTIDCLYKDYTLIGKADLSLLRGEEK